MNKKILIIAVILCVLAVSQAHSLGLGAQVNFYTGEEMFAPGISLLVSPSDILHVAANWYIDKGKDNIVGLTFDICPLRFKLLGSEDSLFMNLTIGIGIYTNLMFINDSNNKFDTLIITGGLRAPVGVNLFFTKNLEIFTYVAPSFGVDFTPSFDLSPKPFFPVAIGARLWFK